MRRTLTIAQQRRENRKDNAPCTPHLRPSTRGQCREARRPCPFVGCRHHLYLEVKANGNMRLNTRKPVWEMENTCSLDVADKGEFLSFPEIAAYFDVQDETIAKVLDSAVRKLQAALAEGGGAAKTARQAEQEMAPAKNAEGSLATA